MSLNRAKLKNRAASWSITARLTFLYTVSAFALLLVSSMILFWTLGRDLDRKNSQFVADKVRELQTIINDQAGNADALQREVVRETTVSVNWRYFARILSSNGETMLETPGMCALLPPGHFQRQTGFVTSEARIYAARDGRAYKILEAETGARNRADRIQFALDITQEQALLIDYRRKMAVVLVIGMIAAAAAGAFTARKGLRPLKDIATTAARISATHLHERIGGRTWPKELAALSEVFDEMLGRLEESFTRLSQFSADLAHELRTPVNILLGEATLALSRARTTDEYRQVLESSIEEYNRLARMIESLLFLARADADRAPLQMKQLSARDEIQAVCEFYEAVIAERKVDVACRGDAPLQADQALFRRAVSNLLSNALDHTPNGGHVDLSVEKTGPSVILRVTDTGCGIPAKHLARVFDRFYRVDPSRSQESRSIGLGLPIVKSILKLHGGSAAIASAPGKGTAVSLTFPYPASPLAKITNL